MPLNRYQIRNEYSLADPDLYKVADKDDPEALLEGVAMAGLVGVLRQLGDLAEFAAEIFHDLHEEVMATAARGHGLIVRVQQLEAEFPSVERTLLSQISHTTFLYNSGIDCHPNLRMDQNLVTQGDLPRFVMDSYEECRGPPRLFLLDKFDVAGAGACLKRFTDPSFFKAEATSTGRKLEGHREKKTRRVKKRGPRWRNGDTPETFSSSHAKLHQLFLEERIETGGNDPDRRVKLKNRQFTGSLFDQVKAKSYMEKFLDTCPLEQKIVHEVYIDVLPLTWTSGNGCDSGLEIVEIGTVSPLKESIHTDKSACSSPDTMEMVVKPSMDNFGENKLNEIIASESNASKMSSTISKVINGDEFADEESKSEVDGQNSDDVTSEIDSYMDALATIESELETDSECKNNPRYLNLKPIVVDSDTSEGKRELQSFDAQFVENYISSEDGNYFLKERDSSSCSVSVETLAETTPDLDAAVVAAASVPASSNTDLDKVSFDHHSMSEEIPGNKSEDYTARSTVAVEADDGSKSMLNTSCFTDQNMILPVDIEENCIPSPGLDEVHSSSAEPDLTSGVSDREHATQTATWSWKGTVADAPERTNGGHLSCGEHTIHDTPESKSTDSVPSSVEEHNNDLGMADVDVRSNIKPGYPEMVAPIDLVSNADFCIPPIDGHSASQSSISDSTQGFNIQEHFSEALNLGHIKEVISDVRSEEEAPCVAIVGQTEVLPPISERPQTCALLSSSTDVAETAITEFVSTANELNSELLPGSADGEMKGNSFIRNQSPVLDPSDTQDQWQKEPEKTGDRDHNYNHDDKNKAFSHDSCPFDVPSELVSDSNSVLVAENILDLHHDVEKVELIEIASQVDAENYHHENAIPLPSSSSPIHEKVKEQPVLVTEECNQNEEELSQDPPKNLNSKMCNMSSDQAPTSASLDGSLANHVQKDEKSDVSEAPLNSESSHQDVESTNGHYLSKPMIPPMKGLNLLDGESKVKPLHAEELSSRSNNNTKQIQTSQYVDREGLVNTTSLSSQFMVKSTLVFPGNDMLNGNNQPSEEVESAPPLPPLPPMQWRLSRFQNSFATPQRLVQHTIGSVQPVPSTVSEISSENNINGIRTENNQSFTTLSTSIGSQSRTPISLPMLASGSDVTFLEDMNGIRRDDNLFLTTPSTSTNYHIGNQISGESSQPRVNPCEPESLFQGLSSGHTPAVVEVKSDAELGDHDERLEHIPQVTQQEAQNSHVQFLPPSKLQPTPGFVAPEAGNLWSSTYDGIPTNANGTLQKKLPRPRNPLIDEVVAIDKSKLRKVERAKPPVEPKPEEGESLREQMQLRKVERVKPPVETKAEEGESLLEHLQLRKVGERVKAPVEQKAEQREFSLEQLQLRKVGERVKPQVESKTEERESLLEQFQLKKVGERVKPEVEQKPEETESPRVQLRKVGERVKPEVEQKPEETESPRVQLRKVGERVKLEVEQKPEETESPRVQLRKLGERAHPLVESKTEDRDSIFEQIRNKSFNLRPAVVTRPNIQGPNVQGPRTNLQVAAILEKASNIRQAMAGSDEEDEADSWSDC